MVHPSLYVVFKILPLTESVLADCFLVEVTSFDSNRSLYTIIMFVLYFVTRTHIHTLLHTSEYTLSNMTCITFSVYTSFGNRIEQYGSHRHGSVTIVITCNLIVTQSVAGRGDSVY